MINYIRIDYIEKDLKFTEQKQNNTNKNKIQIITRWNYIEATNLKYFCCGNKNCIADKFSNKKIETK